MFWCTSDRLVSVLSNRQALFTCMYRDTPVYDYVSHIWVCAGIYSCVQIYSGVCTFIQVEYIQMCTVL